TLPDLAGLTVKDARIAYQGLTIDHLNLEIGHLGEKLVVPVKFSLELAPKAGATALPLSGDFDVTPDSASRQFRFASLELRGRWSPSHDGATVDWDLSAPGAALDLAAETLNVAAFTAHVADARLSGRVAVAGLVSGPSASGDVRLDPLAPRELFDHLGMSLPRTRDAKALDRVSATAAFVYGHDSMRLSGIDLRVDDSHLSGSASIDDIKTRAASFDLSLDHLDADRYLDPDPGSANAAAAGGSPSSHSLRSLHLRGKLAVGHLRIDGIALDRVRVGIVANLGVVQVAPLAAELYGGSTSGTVTLDDRGAVPALAIRQSIQNIDVAAFLADFAKTRRLSGRGNVNLDLTAHGRGTDALLRSLDGRVDANLNGGAIEGIDLWGDVNRAVTAFQQRNPLVAAGGGGGRTRFDAFRASATLENGVASSRDLLISSQNLRVTGTGTTNLVTRAIDYQLQASVSRTPAAPGSVLLTVPVAVTGTLTDPKVSPDLGGIAKQRMRQELDQRKNELKKKLEDKLKDLFGH
ncbi:MAG: AsmA family protein, partial [Gammaproteobacteria bacterium]|nr:AsmA family protein [Gammaproteobacteria bacterium]